MQHIIQMANRIIISEHKTIPVRQDKNQYKRTRGLSRKELGRKARKYADKEFWKRAKHVQMSRESREKNAFDDDKFDKDVVSPNEPVQQWIIKYLEDPRNTPLGDGW